MVGDALTLLGIEDPALPLKTGDRFLDRFLEVRLADRFPSSPGAVAKVVRLAAALLFAYYKRNYIKKRLQKQPQCAIICLPTNN
jgi:hypothetical protein